jgi:hypothetical protein
MEDVKITYADNARESTTQLPRHHNRGPRQKVGARYVSRIDQM